MIAQTSEQLKELMQFRERTTKKSMNIRKYKVHLLSETLRLSWYTKEPKETTYKFLSKQFDQENIISSITTSFEA